MQQTAFSNSAPRAKALDTLRTWIIEGHLSDGQALPSERNLSEKLQVARSSVRWALEALQSQGLISAQGPRTRVVSISVRSAATDPLLEHSVVVFSPVPIPASSEFFDPSKAMWSEAIARGAMQGVAGAGLHLVSLNHAHITDEVVLHIIDGQPKGILIPEIPDDQRVRKLIALIARRKVCLVAYSGRLEPELCDQVMSDHEAGAYELAKWLIGKGYKRILQVWHGPGDQYWLPRRKAGYERALREAGLKAMEPVVMPVPPGGMFPDPVKSRARTYAGFLVDHLIGPEPVDALMAACDDMVFGLASACRLCGKMPNADLAIVGYDNIWRQMGVADELPPMATVDRRNFECGQEMFRLLMERVEGRLPIEPQRRLVKPMLVVTDQRSS